MKGLPIRTPQRSDVLEAYGDLKTPDVFHTLEYRTMWAVCDWTAFKQTVVDDNGTLISVQEEVRSAKLLAFFKAFHANAKKRGIPIFLMGLDVNSAMIFHGWYNDRLTPIHWAALIAVGDDVARTQNHKVVNLSTIREDGDPAIWVERPKERKSILPEGLVLSPITGMIQTVGERVAEAYSYGEKICRSITNKKE